jgi:hypothetical protein
MSLKLLQLSPVHKLLQVRDELLYPELAAPIGYFKVRIKQVFDTLRFFPAQVAFADLGTHDLACAGKLKTLLG